jgi:hypothetical protein
VHIGRGGIDEHQLIEGKYPVLSIYLESKSFKRHSQLKVHAPVVVLEKW